MSFLVKTLGDGQLAAAKATLYTVTSGKTGIVKQVSCHNTSASTTETVTVYANLTGTSRVIGYAVLAPRETLVIECNITLGSTNLIEGFSTNATTVDYVVSGTETV